MKHKTTHITWIIICLIVAAAAFFAGTIYGEKAERRRISEGFINVFKQNFGEGSVTGTTNQSSGSQQLSGQQQ